MHKSFRIYAISLTNLLASACFTVISSFYPSTALKSGVPEPLIGPIFSTFPIASIIASFFTPHLMQIFGKQAILVTGLVLISLSSILISTLEDFSPGFAIVLSFTTRALSGVGASFEVIASNTMLTSDYPEDMQKIIALNEILNCLGLIIGPLVGSFVYSAQGFSFSCLMMGLIVLFYLPVLLLVRGKTQEYKIQLNDRISAFALFKRPRIFIHFFLGVMITFALGVNMPTFQFHLSSYGIREEYIGYWYMITTSAYLMSSIVIAKNCNWDKEKIIYAGIVFYAVAYMLLGPCTHIFPSHILFVAVGHHIVGWACSMLYGIVYLVPLIPYLVDIASLEYGIVADDSLNDAINVIVHVSICLGEVTGPVFGSLVPSFFVDDAKYKITYCLVSIIFIIFGILYMGVNWKLKRKRDGLCEDLLKKGGDGLVEI